MSTSQDSSYTIVNTTINDLPFVYWLFDEALAYQIKNNYPAWIGYDKNVLQQDIEDKLQFKVTSGTVILCVFSIRLSDPVIWRERDQNNAIYLHRIVVNPKFKGLRQFEKVLNWSILFCNDHQLQFLRIDTWAGNENIIAYYKSFGFTFIENFTTPVTTALPVHNRNLKLALLEIDLWKK